ncbi:MAG TPA: NAD(P)-binding domain-containing protein [Candidatus Limnocylindrales bacterium]
MGAQPLRYLSAADVVAAMPPVEDRIALAHRSMVALVESAELPPKIGVRPRQPASHTAAMPALLRESDPSGARDLLGVKWVTAFPGNRARGLPAVNALVVLNDGATGEPRAILDGAPITAERTAAVSGVALRRWWPRVDRRVRVTLVGAGVQGTSHVEVLACVAPGTILTVADRHEERAFELARRAGQTGVFAEVDATTDAVGAVKSADVVLTMVSFGATRQSIPAQAFERARLIIGVDYDMCIPASVVSGAGLFVVDDIAQFEATRTNTVFAGYPKPHASIGLALSGAASALDGRGLVVVNHLGVGLADVVFADAILRRAAELGLGLVLPT